MKIPLDFFLRLIEKFLKEQEFDKVIKKLQKYFEAPEDDFSDVLSDLSLQDIISKYVKENKDLKKKLKAKAKKFLEEYKPDDEDDKEEKEEKLSTKKRKRTMSNAKEEEKEKEKEKSSTKKRKRTMSSTKDEMKLEENEENEEKGEKEEKEEKPNKKRKRTMSSTKDEKEKEKSSAKKRKKTEDKNDEEEEEKEIKKEKKEKKEKKDKKKKKKDEEEDIDLEKEVQFIPKPKSNSNPNRVPFKRIDDTNIKYQVPENLRDNSYAAFMKQTGDDFGKAANDKLIVTRGKGFRKEKTKFKNKTFHGGMTISTSVRSIPLEDADDSSD